MKTEEFDEEFDRGESVVEELKLDKARRRAWELRRVNVDFPAWMVIALDDEAER